jgi:hypothetical protein
VNSKKNKYFKLKRGWSFGIVFVSIFSINSYIDYLGAKLFEEIENELCEERETFENEEAESKSFLPGLDNDHLAFTLLRQFEVKTSIDNILIRQGAHSLPRFSRLYLLFCQLKIHISLYA